MQKYIIKLAALLLVTSVAVSGCSLQYRERNMHRNNPNWRNSHDRDRYDHDRDHYYNNYHRY